MFEVSKPELLVDTFNESVSTIIERKVRGWLSGVIDDMRRSSPVQQWLDSLPADAPAEPETSSDEVRATEPKSDDSKAEETVTENTVIEPNKDKTLEDQSLDVPNVKEPWKRKSLDSGLLTSTPQKTNVKRLQRDHSLQSEVYSPKFKNPLLRDHSLQVSFTPFEFSILVYLFVANVFYLCSQIIADQVAVQF